jgi:hypothetical protein
MVRGFQPWLRKLIVTDPFHSQGKCFLTASRPSDAVEKRGRARTRGVEGGSKASGWYIDTGFPPLFFLLLLQRGTLPITHGSTLGMYCFDVFLSCF